MLALVFLARLLWLVNSSYAQDITKKYNNNQSSDLDLDAWIKLQTERSWSHTLQNISPPGALTGLIVASLSTSKPNYFYSWTRDAAIVSKELVLRYEETHDAKLLSLIKQTISATQILQRSSLGSNASLGEPKYFVNGSAFTGPWGRPQRDGPALRASVYMRFAEAYLSVGGDEALHYVKTVLYDGKINSRSVIKADLEYISNTWNESSFDLWEEVNGFHFFTFSVIHRALREGEIFSKKMKDFNGEIIFKKNTQLIKDQLSSSFLNQKFNYIVTSLNVTDSHGKKSGIDVGTLLGCLHAGKEMPSMFRPESIVMMNTFHAILNSMSNIYPLNKRYDKFIAKAIGRYPEDIYDGVSTSQANPWFIATLTMAEYLYRLDSRGISIPIKITNGDTSINSMNQVSTRRVADEFVEIVRNSVLSNGSIHEQFDRVNGTGLGARDLTWSHVSFLSMVRARNQLREF